MISMFQVRIMHPNAKSLLTLLRFAGRSTSCVRFTLHETTALYLAKIFALIVSFAEIDLKCEHWELSPWFAPG